MDQTGKDLIDMDSRIFGAKESIDSLHQEIALQFFPERATFTTDIDLSEEFASHLVDAHPPLVRRELADQIGSMTRPSDRDWFKAAVEDKDIMRDSSAKEFLEHMSSVNRRILYSQDSGFRRCASEVENDWATFGMAWEHVSYNHDRSNLMFKCHHPKDCAGQEGPDGRVNHVHRKCDMTARSMLRQFKDESKLPKAVLDALKSKDEKTTFKVRHIVIPMDEYEPRRKFPKWAKWADIYITEDGSILQEMPAATFDYIVPRWQTVSGKFYAFSPATMVGLPQARMLQRMMHTLIKAGEKRVDPPLIATEDAVTSPINLMSGAITYIDSEYDERLGSALRPLDLGKDVGMGADLTQQARDMLSEAFFINKLAPLSNRDKQVTAYEASQLVSEYIRTALPLFEPVEVEMPGARLELMTQKVMRAGGYGPVDAKGVPDDMPDILLGENITFEFNNALREARDRQTINGYQESSQLIAAAAQLDPSIVSEVDGRMMFRDAMAVVPGGRSDWLVDEKKAAADREAMLEQQQDAQALEKVSGAAQVVQEVGAASQSLEGVS